MIIDDAIRADREERICGAADLYESALRSEPPSLETTLNLAVLYWQAWDPGIAGSHHLSNLFLERAERRLHELLSIARATYPKAPGPRFWTRYIGWIDLRKGFSKEECLALWREQPDDLEPVMYLYMTGEGREYEREALTLRDRAAAVGTLRGRYVSSVVDSAYRRRRR